MRQSKISTIYNEITHKKYRNIEVFDYILLSVSLIAMIVLPIVLLDDYLSNITLYVSSIITGVFGLLYAYTSLHRSKTQAYFGLVFLTSYAIGSFIRHSYGESIINFFVMAPFFMKSIYDNIRNKETEEQAHGDWESLSKRNRMILISTIIIISFVLFLTFAGIKYSVRDEWGGIESLFTYLDAASTALFLAVTMLIIKKKRESLHLHIVLDITSVLLWTSDILIEPNPHSIVAIIYFGYGLLETLHIILSERYYEIQNKQ